MTGQGAAVSRQQAVIRTLLAISEGIRGALERELDSNGITLQQYNVLRILAEGGADGLPTLAVADRLLERAPGVTRLMDRLERQGLVARTRGADRRQVFCSLTERGTATFRELEPAVTHAEASAIACLNPNELGAFHHFLSRIRTRFENP